MPPSGTTWPEITLERVDLPAPLAPSNPCTSPAASSKPAPVERPRPLEGLGDAFGAQQRLGGSGLAHGEVSPNTVFFTVGRTWSMFSLVTVRIGTRISFSGVPPSSLVSMASADFCPIR